MHLFRPRAVVARVLSVLLSGVVVTTTTESARADGPGVGTPWVVTVGDSYISGEAGRWAGSSNASSPYADALGPTAYFDNGSSETINRCHRSRSSRRPRVGPDLRPGREGRATRPETCRRAARRPRRGATRSGNPCA